MSLLADLYMEYLKMINFIKRIWQNIAMEWHYRRKLKQMRKKDPFLYD